LRNYSLFKKGGLKVGSIIFIILRLAGLIDTKMDWIILCLLISLDTIGMPALISLIRKR